MQQPARIGAAAIITNDRGDLLLVHHTYGPRNWELPGGGREEGESAADTVAREVREETELTVIRSELAGVYYEPAKDQHHFTFRCAVAPGMDPRPDQLEISECAFYPLDRPPRPITDFTLTRIRDATGANLEPAFHVIGQRQLLE